MLRICRMIERVASSDATVMLLGESGTGKEVLAQGLHQASASAAASSWPSTARPSPRPAGKRALRLRKGAFTGAAKTTVGKIETATAAR
jgi:two-component system NtrC family response regulator